jgi:uncharacterized phiE125 gp8 family phage protein
VSLAIAVQPYVEPITLTEMKLHLKQDDITTDDDLITSLIVAARDVVETRTGANVCRQKVMLDTTFTLKRTWFPCQDYIAVPRVPLVSVSSITYVDSSGSIQTWSSSNYTVDTLLGRITLNYAGTWPTVRGDANGITITFISGMAASFTASTSDEVITAKGRTLVVSDKYRVMNSGGALPTGLSVLTDYFVIAGPKLSLTSGGSAVDISTAGTGTQYLGFDLTGFETLRHAIKLLVGYWYQNRQAGAVIPGAGALILPMGVDALIASQHAG